MRITRRELLKTAAITLPMMGLGAQAQGTRRNPRFPRNVILFMTDQERATQHFPPNWERDNLPGLTRLKQNGVSFENAFTNACMCSPARSTWLSGFFPAQHGVKYTLEDDMPADQYPQVELPLDLPNIATVMSAAGFNVVYKGKWHCSKAAGEVFVPEDLARFGFSRWNPPDGGGNQDVEQGGGAPNRPGNHDGRYLYDDGNVEEGKEGALAFLRSQAAARQPFFMIISLVNPHDVLFYPNTYLEAGYDDSWLQGTIDLPRTVGEDLSTKPVAQRLFLLMSQALGTLTTPDRQRAYLNFYGNLMRLSDQHLVEVLETLDQAGLTEDTLIIRTADHGEMGMTHGGQRQKNFNFYEESIRVPLVFSNPKLYKQPFQARALVSHVDFLPTMANLFHAPRSARADWQGVDYSRLVKHPSQDRIQEYIVFTYDDFQAGQSAGPYLPQPNHIVSVREKRYKLAEYYDPDGVLPSEREMYDLQRDPFEERNLAHASCQRTSEENRQFRRLLQRLENIKARRLRPLG